MKPRANFHIIDGYHPEPKPKINRDIVWGFVSVIVWTMIFVGFWVWALW